MVAVYEVDNALPILGRFGEIEQLVTYSYQVCPIGEKGFISAGFDRLGGWWIVPRGGVFSVPQAGAERSRRLPVMNQALMEF
jgi:hypothetical protein